MKKKIFKIDLHIHTPASKCYKGPKSDDEFFNILKKAKSEKLRIIAFTDHNSIAGYKKLIQLRQDIERKQSKRLLRRTQQRSKLFQDILILPGLEFEVSNCVHFLVIFDKDIQINDIENFIIRGGYGETDFGVETPDKLSNWDILHFFNEVKKFNCIVICSHVDSNKGAYNVIPKSSLRAKCFSSEQLNAIEYKSELTKDKIASLIKASKEYQRKVPISFVKFSDAHDVKEIGRNFTFANLDNLSFESLKNAFENPVEKISTEYPEIQKILDKLIQQEISFCIENLSEDNKSYFKKLICALSNSSGGYCLIGVTENKNKVGLPIDLKQKKDIENKFKSYFSEIIGCFKDIDGYIDINPNMYSVYPVQNDKVIISIQIKKSDDLIGIKNDGNIYIIKDNKLHVTLAKELQKMIESRALSNIESKVQKNMLKIESEINLIRNSLKAFPIIRKFEENSIRLIRIVNNLDILKDIRLTKKEFVKINELEKLSSNGCPDGNVIFFENKIEPRLDYAYLRYTPPAFKINKKTSPGETIYLVPGGAVFYDKKKYLVFTNHSAYVKTFASSAPDKYSNKFIAAFLKSSLWLWYCFNKFESLDIFPKDVFDRILLPRISLDKSEHFKMIELIDGNVEKIMKLEIKLLSLLVKRKKSKRDADEFIKQIEMHNKSVEKLALDIDKSIYSIFDLTNYEIKIVESTLRENRIFVPTVKN